jgi:tetratricopeptide (TPR) repeat protein
MDERLAELRQLLARHRADRYPVEHATLQFHLGATLLELDQPDRAVAPLQVSAELFENRGRGVERAKALNLLGAALLHLGETTKATGALERAAELFETHGQPLEQGAARFNLGLVHRRLQQPAVAVGCFAEALERFGHAEVGHQASAAARELGACRLELGEAAAAAESLERALELAEATGERRHVGAAANLLGLARLATEETGAAVAAFRLATSAYPRAIDPPSHAMATANLALAHERCGDLARARLAAWRSANVPGAAAPVAAQARAVLRRLGDHEGDLVAVLDPEPVERWPAELTPNLASLLDVGPGEREDMLGAWIDGQVDEQRDGTALATAMLTVLVELPPEQMELLVGGLLTALRHRPETVASRFWTQTKRAMARFHVPQWRRLEAVFDRLASESDGDENRP